MKVSDIKCKLKQYTSMIICGGNMFEFSGSKDTRKKSIMKGGGSSEGSGTIMSSTNCQGIEN